MKPGIVLSCTTCLLALMATIAFTAPADITSRRIRPSKDILVFPNSKGEVVFSHSKHLNSLSKGECLNCHKVDNPSLQNIQSKFENHRIAHSFCKGCHRELGKGPTECHQCHNYKKVN